MISSVLRTTNALCWVFLFAFSLTGCGFQPLYGRNSSADEHLTRVKLGSVRAISPNRLGRFEGYEPENARSRQLLLNYLDDQLSLGRAQREVAYILDVEIIEPRTDLAIDRSDVTIRYGYSTVAQFYLNDMSGHRLFAGSTVSETSFESSQSPYAVIASQAAARDRTIEEISIDIARQLSAYFVGVGK